MQAKKTLRNLIIILILIISVQNVVGQACGIYRINYSGNFETEFSVIKKIKLPTTMFLHKLELENSELAFIETELKDGEFYVETKSHLTSHLYSDGQDLKKYYQSIREYFPIFLILEKDGIITEQRINISWEKVNFYTVKV